VSTVTAAPVRSVSREQEPDDVAGAPPNSVIRLLPCDGGMSSLECKGRMSPLEVLPRDTKLLHFNCKHLLIYLDVLFSARVRANGRLLRVPLQSTR
jgi:hypothetical protein